MVKAIMGYDIVPGMSVEAYEKWLWEVHVPDLSKIPGLRKIVFNTVKASGFEPPEREEVHRFRDMLVAHRARVTIRYRRGRDIAAGCGQLRAETNATAETQRAQRRGWSSEFRG